MSQPYDGLVWLVWSREHDAWWRPNAMGYCTSVLDAGRFTLEEAINHCNTRSRNPTEADPEVMVHVDDALKGAHGIPDYAQVKAWMDELNPLLFVPPTVKTPAQQYAEVKDEGESTRRELMTLRNAAVEFRRYAHYPHGAIGAAGDDDSVSREKKLAFIAAAEALAKALGETT